MTAERRAQRSWLTAVFAVGGLLIAVAVIGVVGIVINGNIHRTVENAIAFDVELEDRGDDLRVAVLDVRHYHRDLLLNNPSPPRIEAWQERYTILLDEIEALEALVDRMPPDADLPDVGQLRQLAEDYYADFAAVVSAESDEQFVAVAEDLLPRINAIEEVAEAVDREGERRAAASFTAIDEASTTGTFVLLGVIGGLGVVGGVLAFAVLRLVQDQRRLVLVEQQAAARMAEASRAKTDFIADASHELRTPLTVLRGNAEVGLALQEDCAHRDILVEIVDEAARMSQLVDDLLFLARSDASSVPLEFAEVDAGELAERLAARAEMLARGRGAPLVATVRCDGRAQLDPRRIEQAVLILIDNAAKYGPPGETVELQLTTGDDQLRAEVRDRGPGIPQEQLSRVFERFYRLGSVPRDRSVGGAGLGLAIAAAIVEGHGGTIRASAREGGGTVMALQLPIGASRPAGTVPAP